MMVEFQSYADFVGGLAIISGRGSAWLERLVRDQEVGGSNPLAPTNSFNNLRCIYWIGGFVAGS